jgi:hypothetical protein
MTVLTLLQQPDMESTYVLINKEKVVQIHSGVFLTSKKEQNHVLSRKMDGTGEIS